MKLYLALMLLSTAAIAETKSVTAMFSFTDTEKSFETVIPEGQTVKLEYIVTELPKPMISDENLLKVEKEMECVTWTYPGTSPDDPGICGEYKWTGNYKLTTRLVSFDLYKVKEITTDLKTGNSRSRNLPNIKGFFFLEGGTKTVASAEIPANMNLRFSARVSGDFIFGCAVEDTFETGPVLEKLPVQLAVCADTNGDAKLTRKEGKYSLKIEKNLNLNVRVNAFWMVRDFPRSNYVRKDIWETSENTSKVLVLK